MQSIAGVIFIDGEGSIAYTIDIIMYHAPTQVHICKTFFNYFTFTRVR